MTQYRQAPGLQPSDSLKHCKNNNNELQNLGTPCLMTALLSDRNPGLSCHKSRTACAASLRLVDEIKNRFFLLSQMNRVAGALSETQCCVPKENHTLPAVEFLLEQFEVCFACKLEKDQVTSPYYGKGNNGGGWAEPPGVPRRPGHYQLCLNFAQGVKQE